MSKKEDHEVGYKKPPKKTQFQRGVCPNRKGRGKANRNVTTIVEEELSQRVKINENGRSRSVTKRQLFIKRLVADAIAGKQRSMSILLSLIEKMNGFAPDGVSRESLCSDDREILYDFARGLIDGLDESDH